MNKHNPQNKECEKDEIVTTDNGGFLKPCTCTAFTCEQGDMIKPEVKEDWTVRYNRAFMGGGEIDTTSPMYLFIQQELLTREQEARTKAIDKKVARLEMIIYLMTKQRSDADDILLKSLLKKLDITT